MPEREFEPRALLGDQTEIRTPVVEVNLQTSIGQTTDPEATGNGSAIAVLKRIRTLLAAGLPAALTAAGNLKVAIQEAISLTIGALPNHSAAVSPADQASTDAYAVITGSKIDTAAFGQRYVAYRLAEVGGTNGVTFKLQGSLDDTNWEDLTTLDEAGVERTAADIAVTAGGSAMAFVTPDYDAGVKAAFRYYQVLVKSTVAGQAGTARARGFAK